MGREQPALFLERAGASLPVTGSSFGQELSCGLAGRAE